MFSVYLKKKKEKKQAFKKGAIYFNQRHLGTATCKSCWKSWKTYRYSKKTQDTVLVVFFWIFCIKCTSFEVIFFIFLHLDAPASYQPKQHTAAAIYGGLCCEKSLNSNSVVGQRWTRQLRRGLPCVEIGLNY
jgi:hypothetical protein